MRRCLPLQEVPAIRIFAGMTTVAITLKEEHEHFIQQALASGRYLSESEIVAEALSEFQVREEVRKARFAGLKEKIRAGIAQADRGDFAEFTADDVKAAGRARQAGE